MTIFAYLTEHEEMGQVLIERQSNKDGNPSVLVSFMIDDYKLGPEYSWEQNEDGIQSRDNFWNILQDPASLDIYILPVYKKIADDLRNV